ncbi:VgrG protein [Minicystis rosea]|nr:VgrG protein [Minicystis rosea]
MMSIDVLSDLLPRERQSERIHGAVVGVVTNNRDPEGLGRVKVAFPWLADGHESHWARIAAPMAGKDRGIYFLPEVDDEVLVVFEHGRVDCPFVLGALWNGKDTLPAKNEDGKNNLRVIKSRSGHTITLDDTNGAARVTIADGTQKNTVVLDSAASSISLTAEKDLVLKAKGNITLESSGGDVSIKCVGLSAQVKEYTFKADTNGTVEATAGLAVNCTNGVNVNSGALLVK